MSLTSVFLDSLNESLVIILIIFSLMVIVELFTLKYKDKLISFAKKNDFLRFVIASLFGILPGCTGTFVMDGLYMAGLLGFGGLMATLIATSGDEAFLIVSLATKGEISWTIVLILMSTLFLLGIIGAYLARAFIKTSNMKFCKKCSIDYHKGEEFNLKHFLTKHIYKHIFKKHIWKIFLWVFAAIFIINISSGFIDSSKLFTGGNLFFVLIIAALIGILPISGPNAFLVVLFAKGVIPFSILLTNSIIQDGHGLLPIIGFSIEDAVKLKTFNFVFGLVIGIVLLLIGF